jgi:hypothetical protein
VVSDERLEVAEFRRELLDLLGRAVPFVNDDPDDATLPEGGVATCALVVVEWQADTGRRWLSMTGTLASGQEAPPWTLRMLAREALHFDDDDGDGEE